MWAIEIAGVKEAGKAIVGAVERAGDQSRDVGRAQKAMPRLVAHDLNVVVGDAEGRRLWRAAEAGSAGRCGRGLHFHATIIPLRGSTHPPVAFRRMGDSHACR